MIDFLLDNNILFVLGLVLAFNAWDLYSRYVATQETPDDWFETATYAQLVRKHGSRHREFVNTPIKMGRDRSVIYQMGDGYVRRFKDQ